MALSIDAWKGLSMAVFAAVSVVGAAVAVVMKENAKQLYVSCGVVFSAGVLLAGGFVHLLVDSNEAFSEEGARFPWAFATAGMTIVGLWCVEVVVDRAVGRIAHSERDDENDSLVSWFAPTQELSSATSAPLIDPREIPDDEAQGGSSSEDHDHTHAHPENSFSAIILTLALSIHSVIEGLGIGASGDISEVQSAFVAVVAHKGFTSFSLAQGMVSSGYWQEKSNRKYFYVSVGTFTLVSLLGIAIGWAISSGIGDDAVTAALIGVTSGSFIYVAMAEILPQETRTIKRDNLSLPPVLFSFVVGYCLMTMLAIWV